MEQEYRMSNFENRNRDNILEGKKGAEVDWAMFCCYPEDTTPVRMPSLFPIPSHIVRRRTVKTVDAAKYTRLVWAPEYVFGQGALIGRNQDLLPTYGFNGVYQVNKMVGNTDFPYLYGSKQIGDWTTNLSGVTTFNGTQTQTDSLYVFDSPAPLTDDVANGGCRLIGAFISMEYLGRVDDIQGLVEISLNLNSMNTKDAQQPYHDIAFLSDDQMSQAPYYKKFRLSEGIRTIWFPLDESRFDFEEPVCVIDKNQFDALYPGLWDADEVAASIISTKLLASGLSGQGGELWIPGITKQSKRRHRQENDNLHSRNRMEWAINFIGLTGPTPVRINIQYFYETCPHESYLDNFFPTKGPQGMTDISTKMVQNVTQQLVPGPNERSGTGIMMDTLSKLYNFAKPYIVPAIQAGATALGHPEVAAGIGLVKGLSDWGGGNSNGYTGNSYAKSTAMMPYKKG